VVEDPADNGVQIATADLTMAMVLSLAYRLPDADRYTRAGKFKQEQTMALMGIGCPGKTLGLIGMGQVAEQIPARARPFGLKVIYTKRNQLSRERETELGVEFRPNLVDLLRESDFVCVACDYNVSTHKLIGEKELAFMRSDAYLINTARGRIVDEEALIRALQNKKIAGAGLDVFWNEPPHTEEPSVPDELCKLDNVLMAPHNGGATWDSRGLRTKSVADGLIQLIRGQRPKFLLNPQIYDEP